MATRTISNIGGNYSVVGTWVEAAVPTSADTVVATVTSGNLVINTSSSAGSLNLTNYLGVLSGSQSLNCYGDIVLSTGMTLTNTGVIIVSTSAATYTFNNKTWGGGIQFITPGTINCNDDIRIAGSITHNSTGGARVFNNNNLYVGGGITFSNGRSLSGTTNIIMTGTGTVSINTINGLRNNLTFNTAGVITIGANFRYGSGTITYTAGNMITSGSTLFLDSNTILNTSGMNWGNIQVANTAINLRLDSKLYVNELFSGIFSITWSGGTGFEINNYTSSLNNTRIWTLVSGVDYNIINSITITGSTTSARNTFQSSIIGVPANLTLNVGATQDLSFVNAYDINSSKGQTFWSRKGVITGSTNWNLLVQPRTISKIFIN